MARTKMFWRRSYANKKRQVGRYARAQERRSRSRYYRWLKSKKLKLY